MKKLLFILFCLLGYVSFGQQSGGNDTSRYVWYKYQYGGRMPRYQADSVMGVPKDTAYSKSGIATKNNRMYVGNGTRWFDAGVAAASIDSITLSGVNICQWKSGVSTCLTIDTSIISTKYYVNNYVTNYVDSSIAINNYYTGNSTCLPTLLDGSIIWVNGFNFSNTKLRYLIGCQLDSVDASNFSISAADTTDRYTIIYADTLGQLHSQDGSTGAVASIPTIDPRSQILLATYFIPANSTQPILLSNTVVYKENDTWVGNGTLPGLNFAYTTLPYQGLYSTYVPTITQGGYFYYANGLDNTLSNFTYLSFYVKNLAVYNGYIYVAFVDTNGWVSYATIHTGSYGYDGTIVNQYQKVAIPLNQITNLQNTNSFKTILFDYDLAGTVSTGGMQFDNIILQSGGGSQSSTGVKSVNGQTGNVTSTTIINADSSYEVHYVNGVATDSTKILKTVLTAGTGVTITQNAAGDSATISSTGGSSSGISQVVAGYGLTNVNDSTLKADSSLLVSKTFLTAWNNVYGTQWTNVTGGINYAGGFVQANTGHFSSAASDIYLETNTGNVFRGIRASSFWGDAVDAQWFQIGGFEDNIVFTALYGSAPNRIGMRATTFQTSPNINSNTPVGLFEVSNGTTGLFNVSNSGNIGINNNTPAASSILDITTTTKGVLFPRLTQSQMNAVSTPASGLMITNSDSLNRPFIYTGTAWKGLAFTDEGGGGGSGITKAQLPLKVNAAGDSITRRWNVLDYLPGFISGVTDCTAGIQAAINACNAGGGGVVFFPNGIYLISGSLGSNNSQIIIPQSLTYGTRVNIKLEGESFNYVQSGGLSVGATFPPTTSGVILKSTLTSGASGAAVIASVTGSFTVNTFGIENVGIQVKNNPSGSGPVVGGVNWIYGNNFKFNNLSVFIDTSGYRSTLPTNDISGIETPDNGSGENYSLTNCVVMGFKNGFKIGEHVVINNCNSFVNYYGFNFKNATHTSTSLRAGTYWCAYDIYISGPCPISNFKFDAEWQQIGKWYDDVATIKDTANLGSGQFFYTIINAGGANGNSNFIKTGGANINALSDEMGVAANLKIGSTVKNGTFGSVLHLTTGGVIGQDNSNFYYDPLNTRFGVGTNTPSTIMEVNKNQNGLTTLFVNNQNAGSAAQTVIQANSLSTTFYFAAVNAAYGGYGAITAKDGYAYSSHGMTMMADNATDGIFRVATGGNAAQLTLGTAGALRLHSYGAGTATFDASGNITSVSDERLKTDIQYYKSGLKELMKLKPIQYKWNKLSGNEMKETYAGFSAQNVKANIPYGTGENKDGYLSLQDRAIMATLVNAVQEQQKQIEELKEEIKKLKK